MVVIDRLYHEFKTYISDANASCTADGTKTACCDRSCGETHTVIDSGSALGHDWEDATTESPKTCKTCGATEGDKLDLNTAESATEGDHSKCEAGGFKRFWRAIFNFFRRIIGLPKKCVCGEKL